MRLRFTATEIYRTYLKFDVAGLTAPPTSARVRLFVADGGPDGGRIHSVANSWTEPTINWNNAPAIGGTQLSQVGAVVTGTFIEFDVTAAVTGNGTFSFGILNSASDSVLFSSKEGASPPQLILNGATGEPAPVASFSGTPTSGSVPLTVQFTDASTGGTPTAWAWDFQDDGIVDSALQNPSFTYAAQGTYSVRLTVSNPAGSNSLLRTSYITVGAPTGSTVTFVGAGDIAECGPSRIFDEATAALIDDIPGQVYTLGDNVYETGTAAEFANCYEPTWGRHKARTRPSVGNHEYDLIERPAPYYAYFGASAGDNDKGYYSYDLGDWHIVVLNSECGEVGGCRGRVRPGNVAARRPRGQQRHVHPRLLAPSPLLIGRADDLEHAWRCGTRCTPKARSSSSTAMRTSTNGSRRSRRPRSRIRMGFASSSSGRAAGACLTTGPRSPTARSATTRRTVSSS